MKPIEAFVNRIICADAEQLLKDLPSKSIDLVITDPPYGDNVGYGKYLRTIQGNEHPLLGLSVLSSCYRLLKPNSNAYMFCGLVHLPLITCFFKQYTKYRIREVIIWNKTHWGMGYGFKKQYEAILVLEKGKPRYRFPWMPNLFSVKRVNTKEHPHKKTTELLDKMILQSSDPGNLVLDPFAGSGSTLLSAKQLNRKFIGVEIDSSYCQIAEDNLSKIDTQTNTNNETKSFTKNQP